MSNGRNQQAIGVFDSGVGGLTVLRALLEALPNERFVYLGDTARLPYGSKSAHTVVRYAQQAARCLIERDVKLLVIACNTATSVALEELRAAFPTTPVVGVIEPGAIAASQATGSGVIGVIATEGTVARGAYHDAIVSLRPGAKVLSRACPLFVALAEEGWIDGELPSLAAREYLGDWCGPHAAERPDVLVLGCTHFPLLRAVIERELGPEVQIVDSARTTAEFVARALAEHSLAAVEPAELEPRTATEEARAESVGRVTYLATDAPERFAKVGSIFLGQALAAADVEEIDLGPMRSGAE